MRIVKLFIALIFTSVLLNMPLDAFNCFACYCQLWLLFNYCYVVTASGCGHIDVDKIMLFILFMPGLTWTEVAVHWNGIISWWIVNGVASTEAWCKRCWVDMNRVSSCSLWHFITFTLHLALVHRNHGTSIAPF